MLLLFLRFAAIVLVAAAPVAAAPVGAVAQVAAVQEGAIADVVVLGAGFDAGLRRGMVCRIAREGTQIGEVLLVDLRSASSAALILSLSPKQSIRSGDVVFVKILKS